MNVVKGMKSGDPLDEKTYLGPLTRESQVSPSLW